MASHSLLPRVVLWVVLLCSLAAAAPAHAGKPTTPEKCNAAKREAVGKKLACKLHCTAKAAGKDLPSTDPTLVACLQTCSDKFSAAFAKAEKNGGCATTDDADKVEAHVDQILGTLEQTTNAQTSWSGLNPGALVLLANYDDIYQSAFDIVTVGSTSGFTMSFTDAESVLHYLPQIGPAAALNGSVLDPVNTAAGSFGADVLALRFNVDFSDARVYGAVAIPFGDLKLCDVDALPVNGMAVRELLGVANTLLGGGSSSPFTVADVDAVLIGLNGAFEGGVPRAFASHLVTGACTCPAPTGDCSGACVDSTTDTANCGSCGNVCGQNEVCTGSSCTCASPDMLCGTQCNLRPCACVAVQSDPANCGSCGHVCASGVCAGGTCQ